MTISESQKKFLRGKGHQLKPVIIIGDSGLSESLLLEYENTIDRHELIKVRVRSGDRQTRNAIIDELCDKSGASLVTRIGNVALVFRRNADKPRMLLPNT
jgi:RNA-binding protein